jgi:hypothetical protein
MNRKQLKNVSLPPRGFLRTAVARSAHGVRMFQLSLALAITFILLILLSSTTQALIWGDEGLGTQSDKATGELKVLAIAVRFPDATPSFDLRNIKRRAIDHLDQYVKEQSYGRAWLKTDFRGWVDLPDSLSKYKISPYNFKVDRTRVRKLIEDALTGLGPSVDLSQYDHILIIPGVRTMPGEGYGMLCYCANPGMLTGVRGNLDIATVRSRDGKTFSGGIFVGAENAHLGMFAHDFFHALGGIDSGKRRVP